MSGQLRRTAESAEALKSRLLQKGGDALHEASRRTREAADSIAARVKRTPSQEASAIEG
jgi:hypothetical protein